LALADGMLGRKTKGFSPKASQRHEAKAENLILFLTRWLKPAAMKGKISFLNRLMAFIHFY
jgi:hypothetical protein